MFVETRRERASLGTDPLGPVPVGRPLAGRPTNAMRTSVAVAAGYGRGSLRIAWQSAWTFLIPASSGVSP